MNCLGRNSMPVEWRTDIFRVNPVSKISQLEFTSDRWNIGTCRLWIPEGVSTERGLAQVYPYGMEWERQGDVYTQKGTPEKAFGPGNCPEVEPGVLDCVGIRVVKEHPVGWSIECRFGQDRVDFSVSISNTGAETLRKTAAAVCFSFQGADWWSDESTYLLTTGGVRSIAQLGRDGGDPNGFQAWLLDGESYNQDFYIRFWGFSQTRVTAPVWVSRCEREGCSIVAGCEDAYFIHSNPGNPCTDLLIKYGDLEPGAEATRSGYIEFTSKNVEEIFSNLDTVSRKDTTI